MEIDVCCSYCKKKFSKYSTEEEIHFGIHDKCEDKQIAKIKASEVQ